MATEYEGHLSCEVLHVWPLIVKLMCTSPTSNYIYIYIYTVDMHTVHAVCVCLSVDDVNDIQ